MSSLKEKTISGIKWSAIQQVFSQVFSIIITVLLARLLSPADFGVIAMITVFTGFSQVIIDFGFRAAIIQKKEITNEELSSIFWFNFSLATLLAIVIMLCSSLIARFYNYDELFELTIFISFVYIFSGLNVVQSALLSREMAFKTLAWRGILSNLISGVVAILLALSGFGYWSLAVQMVTNAALASLLIWKASPWRPSFFFSLKAILPSLRFSSYLFMNATLNYIARNIDNYFIGKNFGKQDLGLYSKSFAFVNLPSRTLFTVVNRVFLPTLSKLGADRRRFESTYIQLLRVVSLYSFILMCIVFVDTVDFVLIFFGAQWLDAVPLIQWFCICGIFSVVERFGPLALTSVGAARNLFFQGGTKKVLEIVLIIMAVPFGLGGIVIAKTVGTLAGMIVSIYMVTTVAGVSLKKQVASLLLLSILFCVIVVIGKYGFLSIIQDIYLNFLLVSLIVFCIFLVGTYIPFKQEWKLQRDAIVSYLPKINK